MLIIVMCLLSIQLFTYSFIPIPMVQIIIAILTKAVATMSYIMINIKIISMLIDKQHQMTALAVVSMLKSFSSIVFQSIGGYILDNSSYRMLFLFLFACSIVALGICIFLKLPENKDSHLFD